MYCSSISTAPFNLQPQTLFSPTHLHLLISLESLIITLLYLPHRFLSFITLMRDYLIMQFLTFAHPALASSSCSGLMTSYSILFPSDFRQSQDTQTKLRALWIRHILCYSYQATSSIPKCSDIHTHTHKNRQKRREKKKERPLQSGYRVG